MTFEHATIPAEQLKRHPDDGFPMAEPYPIWRTARTSLDAITRAMVPPAPAPVLPDVEERVAAQVGLMLAYMEPFVAFGFCLALVLLDWAPLYTFTAPVRLRSMSREEAAAFLTRMGHSRRRVMRLLILGVRGIVLSTFYDQDEAHRAMNYAPLPWFESRIRLRKRLLAGETAHHDDLIGVRRPTGIVSSASVEAHGQEALRREAVVQESDPSLSELAANDSSPRLP
jgi:hypothetical protein